ncbi:MAG: DNA-processing protein DprA [Roseovarius sp.]
MSEDTHPSTHPLLPPTTEDDRVSWLRLLRSRRVGPATFHRLMSEHGSAQAALEALPGVARAAGVDGYAPCPVEVARAEIRDGTAIGARLIFRGGDDYPATLAETPDAPPFLWAMGAGTPLLHRPMVALVGARNASSLGLRMARALAGALSEAGQVVVSGLARGIDAASHIAALDHGTIAVVAGGVDVMYPAENTKLAEDIARTGLRLSEHPPGMVPQARHFPARNRIISGLVQAVVVVEAAAKSGSLITARNALDQGRDVLAVPGHPFDARAAGCNMLIRDGATLVRNAEDVIAALPSRAPGAPAPQADLPLPPPPERRTLRETAQLHTDILGRLGPSPLAEDQLIRDLSTPAAQVAPALTDLEIDGKIKRHPGGLISLN